MNLRQHLALAIALPLIAAAALTASGTRIPVPVFGREYILRFLLPEPPAGSDLPQIHGTADDSAPLVVIDAGHGGRDPGASGEGASEKDITLALALKLLDELVAQGDVRVALTRENDRFLALGERPDIARRLGADLFISIHADSAGEKVAMSGASIYTLSSEASSEAAARFARRENDADRLNGVSIDGQSPEVSAILIDLSQRRAQEQATTLVDLILREGEGQYDFVPDMRRAADLVVLRAPDMPSILFESGFVSNREDAARLMSEQGRSKFARMMARAIRIYFARQSPVSPG